MFKCRKCGAIVPYSIKGVCPSFKCDGMLETVTAEEVRNVPYYHDLYSTNKIIPMKAKEHTAQLNRKAAGEYQEQFEKGDINVLSCSTTFEMGVDVGELEATFLRNVPPETANYIQRAGRAGRRTSSTAFAVTFARRNSHDINFYNKPEEIISGKIKPPYIEIYNDKIALRHVNSIVMAWFFSKNPNYFSTVSTLINGDGKINCAEILYDMLKRRPDDLLENIKSAIPDELFDRLGIDSWEFAERLAGEEGVFTVALKKRSGEIAQLETFMAQRYEAKKGGVDSLLRLINTLSSESCIEFLASSGVMPKYGFPIDVVKLDIINNNKDAGGIELSRDLKMAVSEFAPPSSIVANGHVWSSYAINTVPDKGWKEDHYYECRNCGKIMPAEKSYMGMDDSEIQNMTRRCTCGKDMKLRKFYIPSFGFSTYIEAKPKRVGEDRPKRYYSTRTQFWGIDELDTYQSEQRIEKTVTIGCHDIPIAYTPNGKLSIINSGKSGTGLWICKTCGYVSEQPTKKKHKNKFGYECVNPYLSNASLGHTFNSDILKIELPVFISKYGYEVYTQWLSTLYALLEGASNLFGIDRNDINGCISYKDGKESIILYDESPGGAGHVKRIAGNLEDVLEAALEKVNGQCGCSEDTSCYGCLRNYSNQFDHEKIVRGAAKEYIEWLLNEDDSFPF